MIEANISGANIKKIRKNIKMQQIELSVALDVDYKIKLSQSDISEIESGKRGIKDYELKAIAAILKMKVDDLL